MLTTQTDQKIPPGFEATALDVVTKASIVDPRPKGLLQGDGRIVATAHPLLEALGFEASDDLRGLPFASLWPYRDRALVSGALRLTQSGEDAKVHLNFDYIHACAGRCTIALTPTEAKGLVLMTLVASTLATGTPSLG